jgi:hypothetical protein
MGEKFPKYPDDVVDGDEPSFSPNKTMKSVLGTEQGTQATRRILLKNGRVLTDSVMSTLPETLLYTASLSNVIDSTPTAFVAYTAPSAKTITRVLVSGEGAADYILRLNGSDIGTRRTTIELNAEYPFKQGLSIVATNTLDILVNHCSIGNLKDFELYIYGV